MNLGPSPIGLAYGATALGPGRPSATPLVVATNREPTTATLIGLTVSFFLEDYDLDQELKKALAQHEAEWSALMSHLHQKGIDVDAVDFNDEQLTGLDEEFFVSFEQGLAENNALDQAEREAGQRSYVYAEVLKILDWKTQEVELRICDAYDPRRRGEIVIARRVSNGVRPAGSWDRW